MIEIKNGKQICFDILFKEKMFADLDKFRFPSLNLVPSPTDKYIIDYRNSAKIYSRYTEVPRADIEIDRYQLKDLFYSFKRYIHIFIFQRRFFSDNFQYRF